MSKKVVKKKDVVKKFYAVRLYKGEEVFIYQSAGKPRVVPTDFEVQDARGRELGIIMDLCSEVEPLFKDLAVGEVREVRVTLE